ncbi:hypothetical protein ZIOFF_074678 [Zingiber officinale]|uniref:TF-B3 domain-containing protein n=1 Tax=Zingiber officinale TaxID=94328 RepID=A0A8J5ET15_ZINOF|nr:hypothetical protein ZIOFF_074678 [Zingiber officinale]
MYLVFYRLMCLLMLFAWFTHSLPPLHCDSMAVSIERNGANSTGRPSFIKFLSPESLTMLAVPRRFVKHLEESALQMATLFSPSDSFWHIQVLLNEDDELDVQFGRGWELFVRAHGLKPGNSVLFHYEGNTVFSVEMFHSDGCCIWYDCNDLDSAAPRCLVQDLAIRSGGFKEPTAITERKAKWSQKRARNKGERLSTFEWELRSYNVDLARAQIYLPPGFVPATKSETMSLDCLGKLWPIRLWVGLNEKIAITTGWKKLVRETKLKEGDLCVFEYISPGVLSLKIERA